MLLCLVHREVLFYTLDPCPDPRIASDRSSIALFSDSFVPRPALVFAYPPETQPSYNENFTVSHR
jgi:hypothetical protein